MSQKNLQSKEIIQTIDTLSSRIYERFPDSGLYNISKQMIKISKSVEQRSAQYSKPIIWIRILNFTLITLMIAIIVASIKVINLQIPEDQFNLIEFIHLFGAGINDLVFIGLGVFFLIGLEGRFKRNGILKALHELRSIAHVIDMHQLTKDPDRIKKKVIATRSSPSHKMTAFELGRYLDYCSEMLSLNGKMAALYVENFTDPAVIAAVNEIESLSTGMSRKIWQKIMILNQNQNMAEPTRQTTKIIER